MIWNNKFAQDSICYDFYFLFDCEVIFWHLSCSLLKSNQIKYALISKVIAKKRHSSLVQKRVSFICLTSSLNLLIETFPFQFSFCYSHCLVVFKERELMFYTSQYLHSSHRTYQASSHSLHALSFLEEIFFSHFLDNFWQF